MNPIGASVNDDNAVKPIWSDMRSEKKRYESEAALCAEFIAWAKPQGWTAYAETAGWDILLVRDSDGEQLGIQAKLRFNIKVLTQTIPLEWMASGPDRRAILVPESSGAIGLLRALGIGEFSPYRTDAWWYDPADHVRRRNGRAPEFVPGISHVSMFDWNPEKRCPLPDYVPDVVAGSSAPIQLTEWKVIALKVCALLEKQGSISGKEIRALGCDPRRWITGSDWLIRHTEKGRYIRGPRLTFDQQHPVVYAQIKAKMLATTSPSDT